MDDINDDDGDDGSDGADDDDGCDFVQWSVNWLMQTLDVDGASVGPP